MAKKKYDQLVYIGRFAPPHNGHLRVVKRGLELADRVLLLVGSSYRPRTPRNPFTYYERETLIVNAVTESLGRDALSRLDLAPIADHLYNEDAWVEDVQLAVSAVAGINGEDNRIGLIGHNKDGSSYYLRKFPQWGRHENVEAVLDPSGRVLSSTDVRQTLYELVARDADARFLKSHSVATVLSPATVNDLTRLFEGADLFNVAVEYVGCQAYQRAWAGSPYPPTFVTADAVVTQSGHVLVVERGQQPGKGLLALPGGFFDRRHDQNLEDTMVRELKEETGIDVSDAAIRRHIVARRQFDDVFRDPRGAFFTTAHHVKLVDRTGLPLLFAGTDAAQARWLPLSQVRSEDFYADHYDIIKFFTA